MIMIKISEDDERDWIKMIGDREIQRISTKMFADIKDFKMKESPGP